MITKIERHQKAETKSKNSQQDVNFIRELENFSEKSEKAKNLSMFEDFA